MPTIAALLLGFFLWTLLGLRGHVPALTVSGSTALLPAARKAAARRASAGERVDVLAGGSLFGLAQVRSGAVDIALSDVRPSGGLWRRQVGTLPVTVVAHPGTGVTDVSLADLRAVLSGAVTDWRQLGGRTLPLLLIFRTPPSGLRMALLEELLGGEPPLARSVNALSNGDVAVGVAGAAGALGFVEGAAPPGALVLRVDGKSPGTPGYPLLIHGWAAMRAPPGPRATAFLKDLREALR